MRGGLSLLRVGLAFGLACFVLLQMGFLLRGERFSPRHLPVETSPPGAGTGLSLGVTIEQDAYPPGELAARLGALDAAGFQWVRIHADWAQLEPSPGRFEWAEADALFESLAQTRLFAVVVPAGSPDWARRAQEQRRHFEGRAPPQDPATFARFAGAFAQRYAAHLSTSHANTSDAKPRYYEIWHEPNIAPNWGDRHIDPVGYAELTRAAAAAIRHADPQARILTGALAPTNDRGHLALDEHTFLRRFLAAGGGEWIDGFAVQPFGFARPPRPELAMPQRMGFDRVLYLRRALEDAGYGHLPIWAARFGWNRQSNSVWQAVSPETQLSYGAEAVAQASTWPWLHGMGWAVDQPHAAPEDPTWGFALTPELTHALTRPQAPPPTGTMSAWAAWLGLAAALGLCIQRGYAAAQYLPGTWHSLPVCSQHERPSVRRFAAIRAGVGAYAAPIGWALLGVVYFMATWPPLILLCWLLIGIGVHRRPHHGLYLAALLLPFYFQHKDVHWVDLQISIPPAYPFIIALIPPLLQVLIYRLHQARREAAWGLAWSGAWTAISVGAGIASGMVWGASPGAVRHVPAFVQGLFEWTLAPLILFWAVLVLDLNRVHVRRLVLFLAGGGALAALMGLTQWLGGQGVAADATLRLTGPYFSPNHMALYLVRTLFILWGLMPAQEGWRQGGGRRWESSVGLVAGLVVGAGVVLALLLTASRGAWLLGAPAGLFGLWALTRLNARQNNGAPRKPVGRRSVLLLIGMASAGGLVVWLGLGMGYERLVNAATVIERLQIWQAAWQLWQAHIWTGVGPGAFFWRYPAYPPPGSMLDPNLRHPHNLWLELLTTWGIIGALWFGAFAYMLGRRIHAALRNRRQNAGRGADRARIDPVYAGVLAGLAAGIAHAQVDAFMALADLAAWNAIAAGILWRCSRWYSNEE